MTEPQVHEGGVHLWTHAYTPNAEDRLASYQRTDHQNSNNINVSYDYDERGVRVSESPTPGAASHFLIDSANPTGYAQVLLERVPDQAPSSPGSRPPFESHARQLPATSANA